MSPHPRLVRLPEWESTLAGMGTNRNTDSESAYISDQLQELAASMGLSQTELSRRVGIDRRTFNPYWTGARPAGLPTIRKIALATGRSVAWLLGEGMGRAVVGIADERGRVTMTSPLTSPSIIKLPVAAGPFAAGTDVLVDPSSSYAADTYMLVRPRTGGEEWFAWGRVEGGLKLLDRLDGELHVYADARYEVVGVIVGMVVKPPRPLSV